ncbi:MAG: hypothetical protein AAFQ65_02555 [Myxococcota bacterium]
MLALIVLLGVSGTEVEEEEAKLLAIQGQQAVDALDYTRARRLLLRSLALHRSKAAAFNLAITERALGHYVEAADLLERLRSDAFGTLSSKEKKLIENFSDVEKQISTLVVDIGSGVRELRLNDSVTAHRPGENRFRLNPGPYRVRAIGASGETEQTVRLEHGGTESIVIRLLQASASAGTDSIGVARRDDGPRSSIWRSGWLWTGVVAVAAASVGAVFLLRDGGDDEEPAPSLGDFVLP